MSKKWSQNEKTKNYKKNRFFLYLICFIGLGIIIDIALYCLYQYLIHENKGCYMLWGVFMSKTFFNSEISKYITMCTTIGSISFSFFSFAKSNRIINQKKLLVNDEFFELLEIKTTYNPWIFLAILIINIAYVMSWYGLFYLMLIYQIISFVICIKNYLLQLDEKSIKKIIDERICNNPENVFALMRCSLLTTYNEHSFFLQYHDSLFSEFDKKLYAEFDEIKKGNRKEINDFKTEYIKKLFAKASEIIDLLLLGLNSNDEKIKVLYSLLIITAPHNIHDLKMKSIKEEGLYFFNNKYCEAYVVYYYNLVFKMIKIAPEMMMKKEFKKIMMENEEVNYAIITYLQNKYYADYIITDIERTLFNYSLRISKQAQSAIDGKSKRLIPVILFAYYSNEPKQSQEKNNFYYIAQLYGRIQKQVNNIKRI